MYTLFFSKAGMFLLNKFQVHKILRIQINDRKEERK